MVTIGRLKLDATAPDADKLLSSTGLSVPEMAAQLHGPASAGQVAQALDACLTDGPHHVEIATRIDADDLADVRSQVAAIYDRAAKKDAPSGKAKE
jgi:hypothetical protein